MTGLFYTVIFLEGYIVLAAELLAIRQMTAVAGAGTDVISIIIAAVLMPLAFGYEAGGKFKCDAQKQEPIIRARLARNFLIAGLFLCFGLSELSIQAFFDSLEAIIPDADRLIYVALYAASFLIIPVYLLGQTIPLLSNLFDQNNLARVTGRILFFSTIGSFVGSIFSTIVLMMTIGVYNTVIFVIVLLSVLGMFILPKKKSKTCILLVLPIILSVYLNGGHVKSAQNILSDNAYNVIRLIEKENGTKILTLDGSYSAGIFNDEMILPYAIFIEDTYLYPIEGGEMPAKDILVLGAGAFTMGRNDEHNRYTYVDIDSSLLEISEAHFLKNKLGENKEFIAQPARRFLNQSNEKVKYDLVIVDVFRGKTMPEHLVTQEFFETVKDVLKDDARLVMNVMVCPNLSDQFSLNMDATVRSVFPNINYFLMGTDAFNYDGWKVYARENGYHCAAHGVYTYINTTRTPAIYTDNKNRVSLDY